MTPPAASAAKVAAAAIVLAAGEGTRMKSALPKVLHKVAGRRLIDYALGTLTAEAIDPVVVVVGPGMESVAQAVAPRPTVIQHERRGTGHAVLQAQAALGAFTGDIFIVYGDTPFIAAGTYQRMRAARAQTGAAIVVLGFTPEVPAPYGRLVIGPRGLERIVEAKDAAPEELALRLCNSGVMLVDAAVLWRLLPRITANNAKGEYYLTDLVALAAADGLTSTVVEGDADELLGINSRAELAQAEALVQARLRRQAMDGGATLTDPATVYLCADTKLGRDVEIGPFTVFGPGVTVDDNATIKGFCHIEGAHIAGGAVVGPHARLRPGADIGEDAHIGNFVEVKKVAVGKGAKANHLAYLGDGTVGAGANIGAGTIFCNYDGFDKYDTHVGEGAFIGSNTALVAPRTVGAGAYIGSGSVITKDVPADALAIARGEQVEKPGRAAAFRARKLAEKAAKA